MADIPEYFICPISLQIMTDPVTATTGITYDRSSIERWLSKCKRGATCPVTKQPIPRASDLTPNHTLRRLIESWSNANNVSITTEESTLLDRTRISTLVRNLNVEGLCVMSLEKLDELASEEKNRMVLLEGGVAEAVVALVVKFAKERKLVGLEESLRVLNMVWGSTRRELKVAVQHNHDFVDALTWVLQVRLGDHNNTRLKVHASMLLKKVMEVASLPLLERLKPELFRSLVIALKSIKTSPNGIKSALQVLNDACPWGRNRVKIVEAGAVFELIELELNKPDKRTTELIFNLLAQMCGTADGRAQLLQHGAGIAMVAKRTIRVSPVVDDLAVQILSLVSKHSCTHEVLSEMLRVGAVSKLCMVLQADCTTQLKSRARSVLRMHPNVWNNSPCIQVYLLTMHAAR